MNLQTNSQKMAQAAFACIHARTTQKGGAGAAKLDDRFASFAREFPSLVHSCGLAQAVAFGLAKKSHQHYYLDDLAAVLAAVGHKTEAKAEGLEKAARSLPVNDYVRMSRHALLAAGWLKRYAEAMSED